MGYNSENYRKIKEEYREKRQKAQYEADLRREELHKLLPGLIPLDREISNIPLRLMDAAWGKSGETLAEVKAEGEKLRAERAAYLEEHGFPRDYSTPKYECCLCGDTGDFEGNICPCMKRRLALAGFESAGIGRLIRTQTFETFDLDYYKTDEKTYEHMSALLDEVRTFAEDFDPRDGGNLLFMGGTGLGKTHMSSALAKVIIEKGYDVIYTTAIGMLGDFEKARFGNSSGNETGLISERYFKADLLIIDDFGAEITNQFTVSNLYNLINSRLNDGKSTVISTNLNFDEMRKRYWDRITSRIFGEYRVLAFLGIDVRRQRLLKDRQ